MVATFSLLKEKGVEKDFGPAEAEQTQFTVAHLHLWRCLRHDTLGDLTGWFLSKTPSIGLCKHRSLCYIIPLNL